MLLHPYSESRSNTKKAPPEGRGFEIRYRSKVLALEASTKEISECEPIDHCDQNDTFLFFYVKPEMILLYEKSRFLSGIFVFIIFLILRSSFPRSEVQHHSDQIPLLMKHVLLLENEEKLCNQTSLKEELSQQELCFDLSLP